MPSPFPGMDPYLESPNQWQGFHALFIGDMAAALNQHLPRQFAARIDERLYVVEDEPDIIADVAVRRENGLDRTLDGSVSERRSAGIQLADPPQYLRVEPLTVRQRYIEIRAVEDKREVVTILEMLSPTNKKGDGRQKYLRKQREILRSVVNLIEVDLLRGGSPTVAVPLTGLRFRPPFDYIISLNRAHQREQVAYWSFLLRDRLPRISVPLQTGLEDVVLDLQAVFDATYDRGAFDRTVDYAETIAPPLSPEAAVWADDILRSASSGR